MVFFITLNYRGTGVPTEFPFGNSVNGQTSRQAAMMGLHPVRGAIPPSLTPLTMQALDYRYEVAIGPAVCSYSVNLSTVR